MKQEIRFTSPEALARFITELFAKGCSRSFTVTQNIEVFTLVFDS